MFNKLDEKIPYLISSFGLIITILFGLPAILNKNRYEREVWGRSSILRDVFIITEAGKVIKSKRITFPMEKDLFAMLITALYDFVKVSFHKCLAMVGVGSLRVDIIKKHHIFFVASSSIKIKHKKTLKALDRIAEKFFS